jgi:hypothetical protein
MWRSTLARISDSASLAIVQCRGVLGRQRIVSMIFVGSSSILPLARS